MRAKELLNNDARLLTICTANICRSPVAEYFLKKALPGSEVFSAGLNALVGQDLHTETRKAAESLGYELPSHRSQQLTSQMMQSATMIFALDESHKNFIDEKWPLFASKTFLLAQHFEQKDVVDPYRMGIAAHIYMVQKVKESTEKWANYFDAEN